MADEAASRPLRPVTADRPAHPLHSSAHAERAIRRTDGCARSEPVLGGERGVDGR